MTKELTVQGGKWTMALGLALVLGGCAGEGDEIAGGQAALGTTGAAAHFVVDRGDDSNDGSCVDGGAPGHCNLRAALAAAAGVTGTAKIQLAVDSNLSLGEIAVGGARVVIEAASGSRIVGANNSRAFSVGASATLVLSGVEVSHFAAYNGGAIDSQGSLELDGAVLAHNRASCSGIGAMTAFATCYGGAISSTGKITLTGGTRFEDDSVTAEAYTASFTNAWGGGGAIYTTGIVLVDGPVIFADNTAATTAVSGPHPIPVGGASASAAGGAIYAGAGLSFSDRAVGHCIFQGNAALADAQSPHGQTASAVGGAIYANGALELPEGACVFADNQAAGSPDVYAVQPGAPSVRERLDEATQSIVFTPVGSVAWVDLHLTVNGGRTANVRMQPTGDGSYAVGPLALRSDDVLAYSFTYFAGDAGHDTHVYTRVVPPTFEPKAFRPEVRGADGAYALRLVASVPVAWADVHFSVNGGTPQNLRLQVRNGVLAQPIALSADDQVEYWMTYSAGGYVFDTGSYRFRPSAPTTSTMWSNGFPASAPGQAIPSGCEASGSWYTCAAYPGSRAYVSGGYRFAGDATAVPFIITGTGPFGTSLVKTLQVAFSYAGAGPRTGVGLVQLPVAEGDQERGRWVSPTWFLRASYLIGGDGLSVALVDVNGLRSRPADVLAYRSSYCRYGCALKVPVSAMVDGTDVDLSQIRYLELRSESGVTSDVPMTIGHILFDDFPYGPTGWSFVGSDLSPATGYAISGEQVDVHVSGNYTWQGTWASGYDGFRFEHPETLVDGATYALTLNLFNTTSPIPSVLRASLTGGGGEQQATFMSAGTKTLTFTVHAPGASPVLHVSAHPVLGHLGPTEGIGIGFQDYSFTASLARIN